MSEIDLGDTRDAAILVDGSVEICDWLGFVNLKPDHMDALCKWWLEQREQQAIEAHKAGRSRPISDIISDLRKEQP